MPVVSLDWMAVSGLFGILVLVTGVAVLRRRVAAIYSGFLLAAAVTAFAAYRLWQGGHSISLALAAALGLLACVLFLIAWRHAQ